MHNQKTDQIVNNKKGIATYDGMMCESDVAGLEQEWGDLFSQAEASGWIPVVDRSEPEPDPTGIAGECQNMAANAGWEPCLGQNPWNWDDNAGFVHANTPRLFCPKS